MKSVDNASIGKLAVKSILYELAATPKPGLVDRNNSGAHDDMDFFTFLDSAVALTPYFISFAETGADMKDLEPYKSMEPLRNMGIEAEAAMFRATAGVNTHKGMIFSMGLICGAAGRLSACEGSSPRSTPGTLCKAGKICATAADICSGVCDEAFRSVGNKTEPTKGERTYIEYGLKGARGEAEGGFRSVMEISLPLYLEYMDQGASENDALVQTLLHLIASVHDTNIISRHDIETSAYATERAKRALAVGGMFSAEGQADIERMDADFIERRISPGGSADLLAITYFLANIETLGGMID